MLAATHLDNLVVLIFFGIAILFQLLTRAAARGRRRPPDTRRRSISPSQMARPISQEEQESDEERIRKFLEALGQPPTSKPPPPVAPRPTYQKPVVLPRVEPFSSPLPPLTTRPLASPEAVKLPQPVTQKREARTLRPRVAEAPAFEVHAGPPPLEAIPAAEFRSAIQPAAKSRDLASILRSPSGLRDAIILREIFGPPRSFQPLDLVGTV